MMDWSNWFQIMLAMLLGAWIHSRGAKGTAAFPGEQGVKTIAGAIADRIKGNHRKIPVDLPRISS